MAFQDIFQPTTREGRFGGVAKDRVGQGARERDSGPHFSANCWIWWIWRIRCIVYFYLSSKEQLSRNLGGRLSQVLAWICGGGLSRHKNSSRSAGESGKDQCRGLSSMSGHTRLPEYYIVPMRLVCQSSNTVKEWYSKHGSARTHNCSGPSTWRFPNVLDTVALCTRRALPLYVIHDEGTTSATQRVQ